jgi:hypothetical protein
MTRRILFRLRRSVRGLHLLLFGRELRCDLCGKPIARVVPVIRGGSLRLKGLELTEVVVRFVDATGLVFEHYDRDRCGPALRSADKADGK